jgi:hypothetical protein
LEPRQESRVERGKRHLPVSDFGQPLRASSGVTASDRACSSRSSSSCMAAGVLLANVRVILLLLGFGRPTGDRSVHECKVRNDGGELAISEERRRGVGACTSGTRHIAPPFPARRLASAPS